MRLDALFRLATMSDEALVALSRGDLDLYVLARPRRVDVAAMLDAANWEVKLLPTTHPYLADNRPVVLWKALLEEVLTLERLRAALDNAA